jgi:hypothetical protein
MPAERIHRAQERREKERLHRGGDLVSVRPALEQKSKVDGKTVQTNLELMLWSKELASMRQPNEFIISAKAADPRLR